MLLSPLYLLTWVSLEFFNSAALFLQLKNRVGEQNEGTYSWLELVVFHLFPGTDLQFDWRGLFTCKSMFLFSGFFNTSPHIFLTYMFLTLLGNAVISWYLEKLLYRTMAGCVSRQQSVSAKGNMLDAVVLYFCFLPSLFSYWRALIRLPDGASSD